MVLSVNARKRARSFGQNKKVDSYARKPRSFAAGFLAPVTFAVGTETRDEAADPKA